jgi:peptidoglycan/LPS O-acetylase OafA/YrhL
MERPHDRAEIDGLRALAVVALVLFHYRVPGATGGYIGIDVFFVIAGYLATRGIVRDAGLGAWSFAGYYSGRLRRVFPALFATLVLSFAAAQFLLMPDELVWFATTALHSTVATSNILYWLKYGYFNAAANDTPLLHTWSIAAGVQIVLLWPLLLLPALRLSGKTGRAGWPVALATMALALSVWGGQATIPNDARAALYLAPFHIAAFAAGALLVWLPALPKPWRHWEDWLLLAGLALLVGCVVGYGRQTPYPGASLLLPILGAVLAIYAGRAGRAGLLLRHPALIGIGAIAFPLYLVHWPLLGFVQVYLLRQIEGWERPALALAALALAWPMARWVERPFIEAGQGQARLGRPAFALVCAGLAIAMMWVSALAVLREGWPWRIPTEVRAPLANLEFARRTREYGMRMGVCHLNMWVGETALGSYVDDRCMHVDPERPNYLILGDSHGGDRYSGMSAAYPGVNFLQMTTASCRPLLDTDFADYHCPERMEYVFREFLPRVALDGVILVGRWQAGDLERLRATLKHLHGLGHRAILQGPAVEIVPWVPNLVFHHGRRAGLEEWVSRHIVPERLDMDRRLRAMAAEEGAEYYSAIDALCPNLRCPVLAPDGKQLLIVDYGHQSVEGALAQARGFQALGLDLPRRQPVQARCAPAPTHPPDRG